MIWDILVIVSSVYIMGRCEREGFKLLRILFVLCALLFTTFLIRDIRLHNVFF